MDENTAEDIFEILERVEYSLATMEKQLTFLTLAMTDIVKNDPDAFSHGTKSAMRDI